MGFAENNKKVASQLRVGVNNCLQGKYPLNGGRHLPGRYLLSLPDPRRMEGPPHLRLQGDEEVELVGWGATKDAEGEAALKGFLYLASIRPHLNTQELDLKKIQVVGYEVLWEEEIRGAADLVSAGVCGGLLGLLGVQVGWWECMWVGGVHVGDGSD